MKFHFTPADKNLMRAYALQQERGKGLDVTRVRFLPSDDVRAYCEDGHTYLIAPTHELFKEATHTAALLNWNERSFHRRINGKFCNITETRVNSGSCVFQIFVAKLDHEIRLRPPQHRGSKPRFAAHRLEEGRL